MAISFIGRSGGSPVSASLVGLGHAAGDYIIVFAYKNSTGSPSLPAGYTAITNSSGNANAMRIGYKISDGTETTSGSWTNAGCVIAHVYRGVGGIGDSSGQTNTSSTSLATPNLTLQDTGSRSWVVGFAASKQSTSIAAPGTTTQRGTQTGTSVLAVGFDSNATVTSWSGIAASTGGTAATSATVSVELLRANTAPSAPTLVSPTTTTSDTTPDLRWTGTDSDSDDMSYEVQVASGTDFLSVPGDYYPESNVDSNEIMYTPSSYTGMGQSVTGDGNVIQKAQFWLRKTGSPTGNAVAKVYAHSGTFGTSSVPTGAALATSDNFDVSTLTTSFGLKDLPFSGGNQITPTNGTKYVVTLEWSGGDNANYVQVGYDASSPSHGGNISRLFSGSWSANAGQDLIFYLVTNGTASLLIDKYSDVDTGFTDVTNGGDTDPFASGDDVTYTVQAGDALTNGNTYYWRARAKDYSGTYGAWATAEDFTVTGSTTTTKTITGVARITKTVAQTQTGKARVTVATSRTQTGVSRIIATTTRTQTGKARIQKSVSQTITGKARIAISSTLGTDFFGIDFGGITSTQTITGKARIQKTITQTITGKARVTSTTSQTQQGKARIQKSVTQTITGKSRIQKSVSQTQTGIARIQKSVTQTITGKSRITVTASQTTTGKARITKSTSQTITGVANISSIVSTTQTITGKARITTTTTRTQTGVSRIAKTVTQTQTGKARIGLVTSKTQTGVARITAATTRTITGKARITASTTRTITGKARIGLVSTQTITGKARIALVTSKTQTGISRITATATRTQTGKARITTTTLRTITGLAKIAVNGTVQQTITGKARIQKSVSQTITGTARIQKSVLQTITGKSRIIVTTTRTITGKAAIRLISTQNITGKASIATLVNQTITGKARIVYGIDLSAPRPPEILMDRPGLQETVDETPRMDL